MTARFSVLAGLLLVMAAGPVLASASDGLVIYSGRSDALVKPVLEKFTERTGIPVTVHSGSSTELLNKLRLEGARTQADLYMSNDAGSLQLGAGAGVFSALPAELLAETPANYRGPDNTWVGLSARARVLVVNTDSPLASQVSSVFELAGEALEGRVAITNSANESFIAGVTVYMEAAGEEVTRDWLRGLRRNAAGNVYARHRSIVSDVAAGRREVGLVNHYYVARHLADNPDAPIRMVIPDQGEGETGVAWNVAGVAIARHSDKQEAALKLVEFLLSRQGQAVFAATNNEYPTRPGVPVAEGLPATESLRVADVPMSVLGPRRSATLDMIEAAGMP